MKSQWFDRLTILGFDGPATLSEVEGEIKMEACQEKYVISTIDRIFLNVENNALFLRSGINSFSRTSFSHGLRIYN